MHDIDRTQLESDQEFDSQETDSFEFSEESELSDTEASSPFSEVEEMDLASELLSVATLSDAFWHKWIFGCAFWTNERYPNFIRGPQRLT